MPVVIIHLFEGRTVQQKKQLAKELTDVFVKIIDTPAEAVKIVFADLAKHNYASGGKLASEKS